MDLKTSVVSSYCFVFLLLTNAENEFTVVDNKKAANGVILRSITNISRMKCAMACGREKKSGGCSLANYNGDSKTCELTADTLQNAVDDPTAKWKTIVPISGKALGKTHLIINMCVIYLKYALHVPCSSFLMLSLPR